MESDLICMLQQAVELYKKGYAQHLIFSSGYMYAFKEPLVMKALAVSLGVPEEAISQAVKMAVCKVNIDKDLRLAVTAKIRQVFAEKPSEFDPRKYLGPGREAIKNMVKHKLHVLGCAGKAAECR